jgi:hypothetical protein
MWGGYVVFLSKYKDLRADSEKSPCNILEQMLGSSGQIFYS